MVVAVISIGVMQMAIDKVVHVIPMGNGLMTALRAMFMIGGVSVAIVAVRTISGVLGTHSERVLVDVASMQRVEVAVVEVVGMIIMLDGSVAAVLAMLVGMIGVNLVVGHDRGYSFYLRPKTWANRLSGGSERLFGRVGESIEDQVEYVLIGQEVHHVLSVASPTYDVV